MEYSLLHYQRLSERAFHPTRATPFSVGLDLLSPIDIIIPRNKQICIPTDLAFAIPLGYYGQLASKSGLVVHYGVTIEAGVIDPDYRGNCIVVVRTSELAYHVKRGSPVAQLILEKASIPEIKEAPVLQETVRGAAGFGSSYLQQSKKSRLYQRHAPPPPTKRKASYATCLPMLQQNVPGAKSPPRPTGGIQSKGHNGGIV